MTALRDSTAARRGSALEARAQRDRRRRTLLAIAQYLEECADSPLVLDLRVPVRLAVRALRGLAGSWGV